MSSLDFRPVFFVLGILLSTLAASMVVPLLADLSAGHEDWQVFAISAAFTLFVGVALMLTNRVPDLRPVDPAGVPADADGGRLATSAFAAVPFFFSRGRPARPELHGCVLRGDVGHYDHRLHGHRRPRLAPRGVLLWRALLQWLGGVGIVAVAIAVLPALRDRRHAAVPGRVVRRSEKVLPRAPRSPARSDRLLSASRRLRGRLYVARRDNGFDAVAHAMATLATGGYSTPSLDRLFDTRRRLGRHRLHTAGALPFVLYVRACAAMRGRPVAGHPGPLVSPHPPHSPAWRLAAGPS